MTTSNNNNPTPEFNARFLRELCEAAFIDVTFNNLCREEFPEVYRQFPENSRLSERIGLLIDHVKIYRQESNLLQAVEQRNPGVYAEFVRDNNHPNPDPVQPVSGSVRSPKVFISYAHDPQLQDKRITLKNVLDLSNLLRQRGIDCQIDQYEELPSVGWAQWFQDRVQEADRVLIVVTSEYKQRFEKNESYSSIWQGGIVIEQLRDTNPPSKFIPIAFKREDFDHIPNPLIGKRNYLFDKYQGSEEDYRNDCNSLWETLTAQLRLNNPEIETLKPLEIKTVKQSFLSENIYSNLPPRNRLFIKRKEIHTIFQWISPNPSQKFIHIIQGVGGIGKTELVQEVAHLCLEERKKDSEINPAIPVFDAFIFTTSKQSQADAINRDSHPKSSLGDIIKVIVETLREIKINKQSIKSDLTQKEILSTTQEEVYEALAKQSTLLIIDNLETLPKEEQEKILIFLRHIPLSVQVIITSREELQTQSSSLYLSRLEIEQENELIRSEGEARNFSHEQIQEIQNVLMEEKAKNLRGHPLILKRIIDKKAENQNINSILDNPNIMLEDAMNYCLKDQVELAKESVSYKQLIATTFFNDYFRKAALIEIAGKLNQLQTSSDLEDGFSRLRKLGLLAKHSNKDMYYIELTTREYVLNELATIFDLDIHETMKKRWLKYYLEFTQKHGGKDWDKWKNKYQPIAEEWKNIEEVLATYETNQDWVGLFSIWEKVDGFADLSGYWKERFKWWAVIYDNIYDLNIKMRALSEKAWTKILADNTREDHDRAIQWLNEAWNMSESIPNPDLSTMADIANYLAIAYKIDDRTEAERWLNEESKVLQQFPASTDEEIRLRQRHHAKNLYVRAEISKLQSKLDEAEKQFNEVIEICDRERISWMRFRTYAVNGLADVLIDRGNIESLEEAEQKLIDGMDDTNEMDDRRVSLYHATYANLYFAKMKLDRDNQEYFLMMNRYIENAFSGFQKQGMNPELNKMKTLIEQVKTIIPAYQPNFDY